jgi:hypothetical protein
MGLAPRCVTLGPFFRRTMGDDEVQSHETNGTRHFDMDEAFCARMRMAIAAGWRMRRLVSSRRPELKIPDTRNRALAASLPVRYGFLVQFPVAQTERLAVGRRHE